MTPIGVLPNSQTLSLAIGLPLRNREALTNLLDQLYDPASPNFRRFLTPEQFTEQFGPTEQDYEAIVAFAQANGFVVTTRHPNRVILDVKASVADVERVLHLQMRTFRHPKDDRTFYAPDVEPSIDLGVTIQDISGLNDYRLPKPRVRIEPLSQNAAKVTPRAGTGPGSTYIGNDFRTAYAPGVALTGAGQTLGLLQFDGYYASDITAYQNLIGLANGPVLQNVLLDGYNGKPTTGANSGNVEVSLDIEMAIAMAPGLSKIIVYEAGPFGNPNDILSRMATDNLAKTIGCSWGWSGGPSGTTDALFQQMMAQGQSFFSASGDSDAFPAGAIDDASQANTPSDNPYITVVGGTTLTTGANASYSSEKVWNWNNGTGSSGGSSSYYSIPAWQQGISMGVNQGSTTFRNVPDVALTADNVYVLYGNGSSTTVGGTSCAAPLWAGLAALINQQAALNGMPPVGFMNPALYAFGKGTNYSATFHDITTGNNFSSSSPSLFSATTGYDLCTGWGTPKVAGLVNALAGPPAPLIVSNAVAFVAESCPNAAVDPGETVTLNFTLRNNGGANTTNLVATLLATGGVNAPGGAQAYGALAAGGGTTTRPFTFAASGVCGGVVTATLQLQDGGSSLGAVSFVLPLGTLISSTNFLERFDSVTAPALPGGWTTTATGAESPWVTSTSANDTTPNAAYVPDVASIGLSELVSPAFVLAASSPQLRFRQSYNLEAPSTGTTAYDGGVLEIKIGNGAFTDIITAGGSFVSGGYGRTISPSYSNPLGGRPAWSGNSRGFVTTVVNLPPSALGRTVQLKWRCGTDDGVTVAGWYIDSISITGGSYTCCTPTSDLVMSQTATPNPAVDGQSLVYTLTITNASAVPASGVVLTDALPAGVSFVSASTGATNNGGFVVWNLGTLAGGNGTNLTVTVNPSIAGTITNIAYVTTSGGELNTANNGATNVLTANAPPGITTEPTNQTTVVGGAVGFSVATTGTSPLRYQWIFNGSNLVNATDSVLTLPNVQPIQAGTYFVIITNMAGGTTSSLARLRVLVSPSVSSLNAGGGEMKLSFTSMTGLTYTLEYKTALTDTNWTPLPPPVTGTGNVLELHDVAPAAASRFYRILCE